MINFFMIFFHAVLHTNEQDYSMWFKHAMLLITIKLAALNICYTVLNLIYTQYSLLVMPILKISAWKIVI